MWESEYADNSITQRLRCSKIEKAIADGWELSGELTMSDKRREENNDYVLPPAEDEPAALENYSEASDGIATADVPLFSLADYNQFQSERLIDAGSAIIDEDLPDNENEPHESKTSNESSDGFDTANVPPISLSDLKKREAQKLTDVTSLQNAEGDGIDKHALIKDVELAQAEARSSTLKEDCAQDTSSLTEVSQDDPLVGRVLADRYAILGIAGEGDVSIVYAASDVLENRLVAMKTLKAPSPQMSQRFRQEVEDLRKVSHNNIVEFVDCIEADELPFYIMELIEASTLKEILDVTGRADTEEQVAHTVLNLCDAVGYLHDNYGVHGNLTPDSILILDEEADVVVKLTGLGTRKVRTMMQFDRSLAGSSYFIDPETIKDLPAKQADIYAIGAIAYNLVTGAAPVRSGTSTSAVNLRPEFFAAKQLDNIIETALNPNAANSYKTVAQLKNALIGWIEAARREMVGTGLEDSERSEKKFRTGATRWTRDLESSRLSDIESTKAMAALKETQDKTDRSLAVQFSNVVARRGRRESPLKTFAKLIALVASIGLFGVSATVLVIKNYDSLKMSYNELVHPQKTSKRDTMASSSLRFDYKQHPLYARWANMAEVGPDRRVEGNGELKKLQ